jgi:hypothetical protein
MRDGEGGRLAADDEDRLQQRLDHLSTALGLANDGA